MATPASPNFFRTSANLLVGTDVRHLSIASACAAAAACCSDVCCPPRRPPPLAPPAVGCGTPFTQGIAPGAGQTAGAAAAAPAAGAGGAAAALPAFPAAFAWGAPTERATTAALSSVWLTPNLTSARRTPSRSEASGPNRYGAKMPNGTPPQVE